jgi:hypothetical protein
MGFKRCLEQTVLLVIEPQFGCTNDRLRNKATLARNKGIAYCINILHYSDDWQQVYAIMLIGYARVSTQDQDNAAQIAALKSAGCELIFEEKASGGRWERPELHRLLGQLRKGDVLVVWKLDRLPVL